MQLYTQDFEFEIPEDFVTMKFRLPDFSRYSILYKFAEASYQKINSF